MYVPKEMRTCYIDERGFRRNLKLAASDLGVRLDSLMKHLDGVRHSKSLEERIKNLHPELMRPEFRKQPKQKGPDNA